MIGIKAKNTKGLKITDSTFQGLETAIELENVEDFVSQRNVFIGGQSEYLLKELAELINGSPLSNPDKKELLREIILYISNKNNDVSIKNNLISRLTRFIGDKAVDIFIQLVTATALR